MSLATRYDHKSRHRRGCPRWRGLVRGHGERNWRKIGLRRPDRLQPQNLEAEQALLGAMLLSTDVVEGALAKVKREDFYRPSHGRSTRR